MSGSSCHSRAPSPALTEDDFLLLQSSLTEPNSDQSQLSMMMPGVDDSECDVHLHLQQQHQQQQQQHAHHHHHHHQQQQQQHFQQHERQPMLLVHGAPSGGGLGDDVDDGFVAGQLDYASAPFASVSAALRQHAAATFDARSGGLRRHVYPSADADDVEVGHFSSNSSSSSSSDSSGGSDGHRSATSGSSADAHSNAAARVFSALLNGSGGAAAAAVGAAMDASVGAGVAMGAAVAAAVAAGDETAGGAQAWLGMPQRTSAYASPLPDGSGVYGDDVGAGGDGVYAAPDGVGAGMSLFVPVCTMPGAHHDVCVPAGARTSRAALGGGRGTASVDGAAGPLAQHPQHPLPRSYSALELTQVPSQWSQASDTPRRSLASDAVSTPRSAVSKRKAVEPRRRVKQPHVDGLPGALDMAAAAASSCASAAGMAGEAMSAAMSDTMSCASAMSTSVAPMSPVLGGAGFGFGYGNSCNSPSGGAAMAAALARGLFKTLGDAGSASSSTAPDVPMRGIPVSRLTMYCALFGVRDPSGLLLHASTIARLEALPEESRMRVCAKLSAGPRGAEAASIAHARC